MSIKDLFKSGESFKFSSPKSTDKIAREVGESNKFIDCIATTETGRRLANTQASHQFKLYTNMDWPL